MKIVIANHSVPFVFGGAEVLEQGLKQQLEARGHQVFVARVPFTASPSAKLIANVLACRLLRVENADRLVALKFPVYCLAHPAKVVWLLHQHREVYDLWETSFCSIPKSKPGLKIREAVIRADQKHLAEARGVFTISHRVSERLKRFNGLDSEVLYPPLDDNQKYFSEAYDDYVFFPSRITPIKRQWLAVESMRYVKSGVKLVIAGKPDVPSEGERLQSLIAHYNLGDKVHLVTRWISAEEKLRWFARALGVLFIPVDEDYGYVTLEAAYSRKALITCEDSGGPLEFVEQEKTGLAVPPDPRRIAEALDRLHADKNRAQKMGEAARARLEAMKIGWDTVIERLLA